MRFSIVLLFGFFIIGLFVAIQFILPQTLQLPFVIVGAIVNGIVIGVLTKNVQQGAIGGFISAFLGTIMFGVLGFLLAYSSGLQAFGLTGLGAAFFAVLAFFYSIVVGLLMGAISAVLGIITGKIVQRREKR